MSLPSINRSPAVALRRVLLVVHRYVGLALVPFLILLGLTGSVITFNTELEKAVSPQLFAAPRPEDRPLGLAELVERAEALAPKTRLAYLTLRPDEAIAKMRPRSKSTPIDFDQLFLDPFTGAELGRRREGDLSQGWINFIPFIYRLHRNLAAGPTGVLILGITALVWTADCFVALYLTLPMAFAGFWRRWSRSWRVKASYNSFRLNFDLHRAGSLWTWPLLLVFAWSSVMLCLTPTYDSVMGSLFDYKSAFDIFASQSPHPNEHPRLSWSEAERIGARIMSEQARFAASLWAAPARSDTFLRLAPTLMGPSPGSMCGGALRTPASGSMEIAANCGGHSFRPESTQETRSAAGSGLCTLAM